MFFQWTLVDQPVEIDVNTSYNNKYKESLEQEIKQWKDTINKLRQEYIGLKTTLVKHKDVIISKNVVENFEFSDHTLYLEYLQSVQDVFTKIECYADKKTHEKIIEQYNKYNLERFM